MHMYRVSNPNGSERSWTLKSQITTWRHYELFLGHELPLAHDLFLRSELILEHELFLEHQLVPSQPSSIIPLQTTILT
jgi:hypothetical protein